MDQTILTDAYDVDTDCIDTDCEAIVDNAILPELPIPTIKDMMPGRITMDTLADGSAFTFIRCASSDVGMRTDVILSMADAYAAQELGCKGLKRAYNQWLREQTAREAAIKAAQAGERIVGYTGSPLPLRCSGYICTDHGIVKSSSRGDITVANAAILPVRRVVNVETGRESIVISYWCDGAWREITLPAEDALSATKVMACAAYGMSVTSVSAPYVVEYLDAMLRRNSDIIPTVQAISRCGYYGEDDSGFYPYSVGDGVECDAQRRSGKIIRAVRSNGDSDAWYATVGKLREGSVEIRVMMAAALSSVLVKVIGINPYWVHLYGETGGGKTVALKVAASIYANPALGSGREAYIYMMSSTDTSMEGVASALKHLPLCLDELESRKDKVDIDGIIYRMTGSVGRQRSTRDGSLQDSDLSWRNTIISTGEHELTTGSSGGGAQARVLNILAGDAILAGQSGKDICRAIDASYGWAGKEWVMWVLDHKDIVIDTYNSILQDITPAGKTAVSKTYDAIACVLTADRLASGVIWHDTDDRYQLRSDDLLRHVADTIDTTTHEQATEWLAGKVVQEIRHFTYDSCLADEIQSQDYVGRITQTEVAILKDVFASWFGARYPHGSAGRYIKWAKEHDLIICESGRSTARRVIVAAKDVAAACYVFRRSTLIGDDVVVDATSTTDSVPPYNEITGDQCELPY